MPRSDDKESLVISTKTKGVVFALAVGAAFVAGIVTQHTLTHSAHKQMAPTLVATQAKAKLWTCSMHPQIRLPKPGKCPICGMNLIPVQEESQAESARELTLSDSAAKLAEIQTAQVGRKFVAAQIRMVGMVAYDETRLAYITAWTPGRLDRLYVDYTGVAVRKGDHLVYLYSPDLYAAQTELINAIKFAVDQKRSSLTEVWGGAASTVKASREKLRLLGVTPEQIAEIERSGKASDHMTIYSPIGGIVVHKAALEGMYVQTGTRIYTIADLSRVWVKLDAYESDLVWIRYAQKVEFEVEAYPGRAFRGTIAFIAPVVDPRTRTIKVRLNVDNSDGALKPDMFVRAVLRARTTADGQVLAPQLAGRWICPMHPEVVKNAPGKCDKCGMPLVSAKSLGLVKPGRQAKPPLVIPATAPLITGKRAVVYVELPDRPKPTFEGREVVLGPRAGDYYLVREGLEEGERVVVNGAFKIDSALQIQAKPSMMSAPPAPQPKPPQLRKPPAQPAPQPAPKAFRKQLGVAVKAYLSVQKALAGDDSAGATAGADAMANALAAVDMSLLSHAEHMDWMQQLPALKSATSQLRSAKTLTAQREAFAVLSDSLAAAVKRFSHLPPRALFLCHCPMAFNNRGANWLQDSEDIHNPYLGATMLKCGKVMRKIE